jgi:hypothetical protein
LPEELLAEHAVKSSREDLIGQLKAVPAERERETLYRLGRGISFHEFECYWDKPVFDNLTILNDGYSTELLNLYPFVRDEWDLLNYCKDNTVNVHRMFTRYWIEGILSPRADGKARRTAAYLPPQQIASGTIRERRRFWELDEVTILPKVNQIEIDTGEAQDVVLLVDIARSSGSLLLENAGGHATSTIDLAEIARGRMPNWHTQVALPLGPTRGGGCRVKVSARSALTCHGALLV